MNKMVTDVLKGENRLLYTYGVTNSGKTYTVQGMIIFVLNKKKRFGHSSTGITDMFFFSSFVPKMLIMTVHF